MRHNASHLNRFSLAAGLAAFALAGTLLVADHRRFFHWLLFGGTFGNLVLLRTIFSTRSRAG